MNFILKSCVIWHRVRLSRNFNIMHAISFSVNMLPFTQLFGNKFVSMFGKSESYSTKMISVFERTFKE